MERAERKRKEIAEAEQLATKGSINFDNIEEMDVDDDFDFNDDLEVWNAPKTTKFHSETLMDKNNPFSFESPQQPAEENTNLKKLASSPKVGGKYNCNEFHDGPCCKATIEMGNAIFPLN